MTNPPSPRFTSFIRDIRTSKHNLQQTFSQPITATSTTATNEQLYSSRSSTPSVSSVDSIHHQAIQKTNDVLRAEIHRLTESNEDNMTKLKLQLQHLEEVRNAYKQLEIKYNHLLEQEEYSKKDKNILESILHENEQLKEKIHTLETELLTVKSTQSHHHDLQINLERLQTEIQHSIKERETVSILNTQLHDEITGLKNINERLNDECDKIRTILMMKSDENEQLKIKNNDLESTIKSLRDMNDFQRRLNDENELNKQKLQRKQDDLEQFEKMHDATKRENQLTIHLLQEKIHDLEQKTELQSLKHDDILRQFESLKKRSDRILPLSNGNILSTSNHQPIKLDSQLSLIDDSAPIQSHQRSLNINDKSAQIVLAKYSYEPLKYSPNDHPEIELPLKLGEYYLVYGDIDEDGFYDGRNLEGRYGLIPSNFVELVANPSDLPENIKHIIQNLTGKIFPTNERNNSRQRELTFSIESDVFTNNTSISIPKVNSISSEISNDNLSYGKHIPYPTNLRIEKSLSTSVLIAWNSPLSNNTQILGYQVLLDHSLYTTISINERTRALIENINLNDKSHRISIRTITQRGLSHDQQCTLLLTNSKDLSDIPTDLRVDRITQTTAVVSWWPASNDIIHKLYVNDIEVQTLKSGTYRFKLSGLLPNTMHKVTIKAKPSTTITSPQQQLSASIEFRTATFDESIQPPRRIQVIPGPQLNTLLISWEQLSSINTTRGYRILIDGRQIQDITNPLNDHTVLNLNNSYPGRYLTVRTLTDNNGESNDSNPIDLDDVLKKISRPVSTISQDMNKSLTHSLLESSSTASTISTDIQQIELRATSPRTLISHIKSPNRTPTNDNEQQHSIKTVRLQSPSETNNHLLNKINNNSSRLFIALFDYDPHAMSPNQDNEEELPFKQGQIIKIYGDQDADGFYIGQIDNGRTGYVPSNMVSEIESNQSDTESHNSSIKRTPSTIKKMIALFDYNPNMNSPNKNPIDELSFHTNDIIYIHGNVHDDGFYYGELASNGKKGLIPSNYLKEISDENLIQKDIIGTNETKQPSVSVNNEIETSSLPTEPPKIGFFDRLKSTFTWNSNEPI